MTGIRTQYGRRLLKPGPFSKTLTPGPEERTDWGSIDRPDVLMIPIGGKAIHNTIDAGKR